jgi:Domain of unknown function (DUF4124)
MKALFLLLLLVLPLVAYADLYRWVDPESGSVKLSNTPPPWYETGSGPKVERIPFAAPASRASGADSASLPVAALQARWREALLAASAQPSKERLEALAALTADLERADPAGATRRREEAIAMLRRTAPR